MSICVHPWRAKRNQFRRALLHWYGLHGRNLPWRHTRDPYAILVSEFMLQQTQVATVIPYFRAWIGRFPNFAVLAAAEESEVLHAWQGLGYYNRARNLHGVAKIVARDFAGVLPNDPKKITDFPGLGRYTANAVATFAFGQSAPIVEANISRLFARLTNLQIPIDSAAGRQFLWQIASALVPAENAGVYNSALMDLGATICTARQPKCNECPVKKFCSAETPNELPIKSPRRKTQLATERHTFNFREDHVLLEQSQARWRGMWILPALKKTDTREPLHVSEFPFTHHRITLEIFPHARRQKLGDTQRWFHRETLASIPMPSPHRRALTHLLARKQSAA